MFTLGIASCTIYLATSYSYIGCTLICYEMCHSIRGMWNIVNITLKICKSALPTALQNGRENLVNYMHWLIFAPLTLMLYFSISYIVTCCLRHYLIQGKHDIKPHSCDSCVYNLLIVNMF